MQIVLDLKVEEGFLKVINDEFHRNVARLEATLKMTQAEVGQEVKTEEKIGVPEVVEEPKSDTLAPPSRCFFIDQA